MSDYDHKKIETKWQKVWDKKKVFAADDFSKKPKFYGLIEFPYPSGEGLHVGHIRSNTAMDVISRKRRMEGFDVLYPIGWDAFGLPTENYAIKTGIHPTVVTKKNTDTFRRQLKSLGYSFDWSREINTTDPAYYKWTQWIFLQFFKHGLAYKKKMPINWCPKDKTGLANEEVIDGKCERCGTPVEKRDKEQWMLAITKYAERLGKDLDEPIIVRGDKNELPKKILVGTRNPAKVKMVIAAFPKELGIEFVSLNDVPSIDDSALVEGDDFRENARKKAEFYFKKTGLPTISTDHILWIEKFPENGGYVIHARKLANPNSPRATDDEVAEWIEKLIDKHGESKAAFNYAIAYTDKTGTIDFTVKQKEYLLQKSKSPMKNEGYVFDRYLKDLETGEFRAEQQFKDGFTFFNDFINNEFVKIFDGEYHAAPPDYLEKIKIQQKNWIGRSEGVVIKFAVAGSQSSNGFGVSNRRQESEAVEVFTTRPDTLFGCTYLVVAPENPIIENLKLKIENREEILRYIVESKKKSELERTEEGKEKTGIELKGVKAINPANGEEIPIWIADYVLAEYGTGAIMAVPAHDERDFQFAQKNNLPIKQVIEPVFVQTAEPGAVRKDLPFVERQAITAIVRHWSEDKYMGLKWKKVNWQTFITGGPEGEQTPEEGAIAEIVEETGYLHPKLVKKLSRVHSQFFHVPKNVNRFAHFDVLCFELSDGEKQEISEQDKSNHDVVWLSPNEVLSFLTPEGHKYNWLELQNGLQCYTGDGIMANSGKFDGMNSEKAKWEIAEAVGGKRITKYKLRDWVFSRQHYWGEPIPVVWCDKCGEWVAVPEKDLPVKLPKVEKYQPTDTGESPLAAIKSFVDTKCPRCGSPARRETDTMPNWAGSSWYYLRYIDPNNKKVFAARERLDYWLGNARLPQVKPAQDCAGLTCGRSVGGGVDWYNGGMEHTTLHLLYSRFWHKFLFDLGLVSTSEPYAKRTSHGLILAEGGVKMSKSKGNVIKPDDLVARFGADSLRLYEMFMGPFEQAISWSPDGIVGTRRFVEKVWRIGKKVKSQKSTASAKASAVKKVKNEIQNSKLESLIHKSIKKVGEDIETMRFNTAISTLMICANEMDAMVEVPREIFEMFLKILSPFSPHICEELWSKLGNKGFLAAENWPAYETLKILEEEVAIVVQVNGKVRGQFSAAPDITESKAVEKAKVIPEIAKWFGGKNIKRVIYIKGRLVNLIVA